MGSVVNGVDDSGEPQYATEAAVRSACNDNDACPGYYKNPTFPSGKQWRPFKSAPGVRPDGFWSPSKFPVVKKKMRAMRAVYQYTMSVVNGVDDSGEPQYATEAAVQSACNDNDACPGYY